MTNCPQCGRPPERSAALGATVREGLVMLVCRGCRRMAPEPPTGIAVEWIDGGPGWQERAAALHREGETTAAIVGSDDDDPRWTTMEVMGW